MLYSCCLVLCCDVLVLCRVVFYCTRDVLCCTRVLLVLSRVASCYVVLYSRCLVLSRVAARVVFKARSVRRGFGKG